VRPADADLRLKRTEWTVGPVQAAIADRLIARFHYSAGSPKQHCYLHGLFRNGDPFWDEFCQGAAHWLPPTRAVAVSLRPKNPNGVLALSRLVCADYVPGNGASFLMARSMRLIDRIRWPVLVTYADEWQGHTGAIYLATGWTFDGLTAPKPVYRLNGRSISPKSGPKTRSHAEMLALGAEFVGKFRKRRFVHRRTP
jgi:hypothetical protein